MPTGTKGPNRWNPVTSMTHLFPIVEGPENFSSSWQCVVCGTCSRLSGWRKISSRKNLVFSEMRRKNRIQILIFGSKFYFFFDHCLDFVLGISLVSCPSVCSAWPGSRTHAVLASPRFFWDTTRARITAQLLHQPRTSFRSSHPSRSGSSSVRGAQAF